MSNRYRLTLRPLGPGTIPSGTVIVSTEPPTALALYGYFSTAEPIAPADMRHFDLLHWPEEFDSVTPGQERLDLMAGAVVKFDTESYLFTIDRGHGATEMPRQPSRDDFRRLPPDTPQNRATYDDAFARFDERKAGRAIWRCL